MRLSKNRFEVQIGEGFLVIKMVFYGKIPGKESVRRSMEGDHFFIPDDTRRAMKSIASFVVEGRKEYNLNVHKGAVDFDGVVTFNWDPGGKKKKKPPQFHIRKPDVDNLQKTLFDGMKKGKLFKDDCHISSARLEKEWGDCDRFEAKVTLINIED